MISIAGKIFILGEYNVVKGGDAVLAALRPSMLFKSDPHPRSPAGRFFAQNQLGDELQFEHLPSGFGSSTAELIAANALLKKPWEEKALWKWYRERFAPASGADLVVQFRAKTEGYGLYRYSCSGEEYQLQKLSIHGSLLNRILVFQAPSEQKIKTHENLESQSLVFNVEQANALVNAWIQTQDPKIFTQYAALLQRQESSFSKEVREAFTKVPRVLGVKGCGAGLNDVFLVALETEGMPEAEHAAAITAIAEKFQLKNLGSLKDHV